MKSLLDIQQEIRNLEKNLTDISASIKGIGADIEELRNADHSADIDYSKIETFAKNIPIRQHPLGKLHDDGVRKVYLEMLLNIVRLDSDEEVSLNRLVFIQWIKSRTDIDWTLEDLYKDCHKMKSDTYHEMADVIPTSHKKHLIVDALIAANIGGKTNADIYAYIADLAMVLRIDKQELKTYSLIARATLCQSAGIINHKDMGEFQRYAKLFRHYINQDIMNDALRQSRQVIVELPDDKAKDFKWCVKQGQYVKKGDVVATYSRVKRKRGYNFGTYNYAAETLKSPSEGMIFQFRDNCTYYGVISHEADNKDSIKEWVKAGRNGS